LKSQIENRKSQIPPRRPFTLLVLCGSGPLIGVTGLIKAVLFILLVSRTGPEWVDLIVTVCTRVVPEEQLRDYNMTREELAQDTGFTEQVDVMLIKPAQQAAQDWRVGLAATECARLGLCVWLAVTGAGALSGRERWRRRFSACSAWNIPYHAVNGTVMCFWIQGSFRNVIDTLKDMLDKQGGGLDKLSPENLRQIQVMEYLRIGSVVAMIVITAIWIFYYAWSVRYLKRADIRALYDDKMDEKENI
jgi:hypothetical protein